MSLKRDVLSGALVALVLVLIGATAYVVFEPQLRPHVTVQLGNAKFSAWPAKTDAEREKGLSGTRGLSESQAMLFVYPHTEAWSIWMKDMHYPIDIVWLDENKKVVYIVKNAPPESYPYEKFTPNDEARYVIEFAAGTVGKRSIAIGSQAVFDENVIEGWKL